MKKVAIDIHGVLDANPKYFVDLAKRTLAEGGEVHILTGSEHDEIIERYLLNFNNGEKYWTHFSSVITILKNKGIPMYFNAVRGHWCVENNDDWDKVKGEYCEEHHINEMYDDTIEYRKYMPEFTSFFLYSHDPITHEAKLARRKHGES